MYLADSRAGAPESAAPSAESAARPRAGRRLTAVGPTVLALGTVSLITDVSSEMVTAVLPLYLVAGLGLSPLGFGLLDGIHNGFSALVRLAGGHLADRGGGRHKWVAGAGYALSALCKPLLLVAQTLTPIGLVLAADRTGKGLRTAPRDALISLSSTPETRGRAFGVHRAMDTAGALLGPLVAFLILRATADGYDAVFTMSFCVALVGVLVLVLFVPDDPAARPASAARAAGTRSDTALAAGTATVDARDAAGVDVRRAAGTATVDARDATDATTVDRRDALVPRSAESSGSPDSAGPRRVAEGTRAPVAPAAPAAPRPTLRAALALLRRPELRGITLCALLLGLATVSDSFVFLLLQRRLGVPDRW
ncbi:MFS transporter, partial [Streptomyces populi]